MPKWLENLIQPILDDGVLTTYPLTYDIDWVEPEDPTEIPWWQITIWPALGTLNGKTHWESDIAVAVGTLLDLFGQVNLEYLALARITADSKRLVFEIPSRKATGSPAVVLLVYYTVREDSVPIYDVLDPETGCYKEVESGTLHNATDPSEEMN